MKKKLDKVKLYIVGHDRTMHIIKVRPDLSGRCCVKLHNTDLAYLVPLEQYGTGQRDFFYRINEAAPIEFPLQESIKALFVGAKPSVTEVPPRLVFPAVLAQAFQSLMVSHSRAGRTELMNVLGQAWKDTNADFIIKTPNGELRCTLEEVAEAIEDVENNKVD